MSENAVELGRMSARLVHLERRLGRIEDDSHGSRRALGRGEQRRLPPQRIPARVAGEVDASIASQPAHTWCRPKLFGKLRRLHLVVAGGLWRPSPRRIR